MKIKMADPVKNSTQIDTYYTLITHSVVITTTTTTHKKFLDYVYKDGLLEFYAIIQHSSSHYVRLLVKIHDDLL